MANLAVSLIITTKNEEKSIASLCESILHQSVKPTEILVADAGSTDKTVSILSSYAKKLPLRVLSISSTANRAEGRNTAIKAARYEHILITDAGCFLDRFWVAEMKKGFTRAPVVAGYYAPHASSLFERCVAPYALVMPDKLNPQTFLPATRSMGITKSVFTKLGRFPEQFRYAEDYTFARRIQKSGIRISVVPTAIVYWKPRSSLASFARMIFEHAYGDGIAKNFRPKVLAIFARYSVWVTGMVIGVVAAPSFLLFVVFTFLLYLLYAIVKSYRYVQHGKACVYLPLLQVTSDIEVMRGTLLGLMHS